MVGDKSITIYKLPSDWILTKNTQISPQKAVYGFQYDEKDLSYSFYLTDYEDVWIESVDKKSMIEKSKKYGYMDTDSHILNVILLTLNEKIGDMKTKTHKFALEKVGEDISFEIETKEITWKFILRKQPKDVAAWFYAQLNVQHYSRQLFFEYFADKLEETIYHKDAYIKFLEMNLKRTHNGEELLNKFIRNNQENRPYFDRFDMDSFSRSVQKHYEGVRRKEEGVLAAHNIPTDELLWSKIEKAFDTKYSWIPAKDCEEIQSVAASTRDPLPDEDDDDKIKLVSPTKRKRRRIGTVGPK